MNPTIHHNRKGYWVHWDNNDPPIGPYATKNKAKEAAKGMRKFLREYNRTCGRKTP